MAPMLLEGLRSLVFRIEVISSFCPAHGTYSFFSFLKSNICIQIFFCIFYWILCRQLIIILIDHSWTIERLVAAEEWPQISFNYRQYGIFLFIKLLAGIVIVDMEYQSTTMGFQLITLVHSLFTVTTGLLFRSVSVVSRSNNMVQSFRVFELSLIHAAHTSYTKCREKKQT